MQNTRTGRGNQGKQIYSVTHSRRMEAERASLQGVVFTVQGQIKRAEAMASAGSPAGLFGLVKPEGASVRFSLNLSAVSQGHGDLSWPDRDDVLAAIRCGTSHISGNGLHQLGQFSRARRG